MGDTKSGCADRHAGNDSPSVGIALAVVLTRLGALTSVG